MEVLVYTLADEDNICYNIYPNIFIFFADTPLKSASALLLII